jgi:hypothetical protein
VLDPHFLGNSPEEPETGRHDLGGSMRSAILLQPSPALVMEIAVAAIARASAASSARASMRPNL